MSFLTALGAFNYALVLLYGLFLSAAIAGGWENRRQKRLIIALCPLFLLIQTPCWLILGEGTTKQLYPLIVHLPLVLILILALKKPVGIALVSVCTAYLCCQLPRWVNLAVTAVTRSPLVGEISYTLAIYPIFLLLRRYFVRPAYSAMTASHQALLLFGSLPVAYYFYDYATVVYSDALSTYVLPEILPAFGRLHPNTFFVIHQSDSQGVIDGLTDGVFDVGLTGMPCQQENLVCRSFCRDRMVLITPVTAHFLELQARAASPVDILLQEPVILREKGSGSKKSVDRFLERAGIPEERLQVCARINDPEAIKNLVAGGLGISIVSARAARNFLLEKRLLAFELPEWANTRRLFLVYRAERAGDRRLREFMEFVVQHYAAEQESE